MVRAYFLAKVQTRWRARSFAALRMTENRERATLILNLSLSEERSAKAAKRCRRERCNARQRTNAYSSNLGVEYGSAARQQHHFLTRCEKKESVVTTAGVAPLPALTFGGRRPLLGQGEVRTSRRNLLRRRTLLRRRLRPARRSTSWSPTIVEDVRSTPYRSASSVIMPPFGLRHSQLSASACGQTCHPVRMSPS